MNSFRKTLGLALMTILLAATLLPAALALPRAQGKPDSKLSSRLAGIIEQSGYSYKKAADNVWLVSFKGNSLKDIQLVITSAENIVIMGTVIAKKDSLKVSPEMMHKLLRLANDLDRVKIGFDADEDLFVRAEVTAKCFDVEELKANLEQVAAASDEVHANIKAYLVK